MEIKELVKEMGAKHGEAIVKDMLANIIKPMIKDYIEKSETKLDDVFLPFLDQIELAMQALADGIHDEKK